MDNLVLRSPAKLNLYLDVLRKRPDGYHDIETVFEKISLFDIISIRKRDKGIKITTNAPNLPVGRKNLAYRAAELLLVKAGFKGGVSIDIKKNIPIAAGLGGGSSNAAVVLLGVNRLLGLGLKKAELIRMGRSLGADVPFFLYNCRFALGTSKGDNISPLYINKDINIWHMVISFDFGVATKTVYDALNLRLTQHLYDVKILSLFLLENDLENLGHSLYNKLEEVVLNKYDEVRAAKELLLKEGAYGALLSGSGPSVFGITKTREEAIALKRRVQRHLRKSCKMSVVNTLVDMKGVL